MNRTWKTINTVVVVAAMVSAVACGKSEEEKQAEAAAESARSAAEAMGGAAQGMTDMAKALEGMAASLGGGEGKAVEPLPFDMLAGALPAMPGWEMSKPRGERMTAPFPFSQSEASYSRGEATIDVTVVDAGFAQMLIAPWTMMLASGYSRESSEAYEKAVSVGGNPGFEKYDRERRDGELNILVNKRFLVTIEGGDLADTKVLHEFVSKMDLRGLK